MDLESRVTALEQEIYQLHVAVYNLQNSSSAQLEQRVFALETEIYQLHSDVFNLQNTVNQLMGNGNIKEQLDLLDQKITNLRTAKNKLITILMSYANQRLLSKSSSAPDSALYVNLYNEIKAE